VGGQAWGKLIEEVQTRLSAAHKNATEDKKLCNRTSFALDYLYQMKDMSYLIEAVKSLDVATRHSANSCIRMTEESGRPIQILVDLLTRCNRSLPHMEVITGISEVLISLSELEETRNFMSEAKGLSTILLKTSLEMMRIYREKNQLLIFSKFCAFLWKMSHNGDFAREQLASSLSVKSLNEFEIYLANRKSKRSVSGSNLMKGTSFLSTTVSCKTSDAKILSAKHGMQLSNKIVRFHSDPYTAIAHLNRKMKRVKTLTSSQSARVLKEKN